MSRDDEVLLAKECSDLAKQPELATLPGGYRVDLKACAAGSGGGFASERAFSAGEDLQNISPSKSEPKKFNESAELLRSIFDSVGSGILAADDGRIVLINKTLARMLGYENSEELLEADFSDVLTQEDDQRWRRLRKIHLSGKSVSSLYKFKGKRKDGSPIELEASFKTSAIADRTYFIATIRESCKNKRFAQLIQESERDFRLLGDSILHQVWTANPDGHLDYANARALEYRGLSMREALEQVWQEAVHPDDLPLCSERWERALQTGEPYEVEFRLLGADGKYRWHLGRATAKRDENGKIIKWFGTNTDIMTKNWLKNLCEKAKSVFSLPPARPMT